MQEIDLTIPDFLLTKNRPAGAIDTRPQTIRKRRWTKRQRTDWSLPKTIEPAGLELLAQQQRERRAKERAKAAAKKERLAMLRRLKGRA